jgi:hypothetical protein
MRLFEIGGMGGRRRASGDTKSSANFVHSFCLVATDPGPAQEASRPETVCLACQRADGDVMRIKDASKPGSQSETLHEACAPGWFGGEAATTACRS